MKFQPGDKVKVIQPKMMKSPEGCTFVTTMSHRIGDVLTIREWGKRFSDTFYDDPVMASGTHYKTDECSWTFHESWLELVKSAAFLTDEDFEI